MPEHSNHPVSQVIINAGVQNDCSNKDELYAKLDDAFKQRSSINKHAYDALGKLPIHYAAENYNLPALEWLCDKKMHPGHKADVNAPIVNVSSALSLAVQFENPAVDERHTLHRAACVDFLLAQGADLKVFEYGALQRAARAGNLVFLKKGIESLWNLREKLDYSLSRLLFSEAIAGSHQNIISYLIDLYKKIGRYIDSEFITIALLNLLQTQHPKAIETVNLVFSKIDGINFTESNLNWAVTHYSAHVMRTLIEVYKFKVTTNIFVRAAGRDHAIFAQVLPHFPCDKIDHQSNSKSLNFTSGKIYPHRALSYAIQKGRMANVKLLLKKGAVLFQPSPEGGSPEVCSFIYIYEVAKIASKALKSTEKLKIQASMQKLNAEDLQDLFFLLKDNPLSLSFMQSLEVAATPIEYLPSAPPCIEGQPNPAACAPPPYLEEGSSSVSCAQPDGLSPSSTSVAPHASFFPANSIPEKRQDFFKHLLKLSTEDNPLNEDPDLRLRLQEFAQNKLANLTEDSAHLSPEQYLS